MKSLTRFGRRVGLPPLLPHGRQLAEPGAADPPSPRWLYDVFKRAGQKAGVPTGRKADFVLHDLRHWAASTALREGHDPVTVATRLGHSPDTLLHIYAQEIEQGQAEVAKSLAKRLDGYCRAPTN